MEEITTKKVAEAIRPKSINEIPKDKTETIQPVSGAEGGKTENSTEEPSHFFLGKRFDTKKLGKEQGQNINNVRPKNHGENIDLKA